MTLLEEFHDQLYAAAERQARHRLKRRIVGARQRLGTIVVTGLSVAVAVAVAAVVLTSVKATSSTTTSSRPSAVVRSRRELLQTIGELRTPQTLVDRRSSPPYFFGVPFGPLAKQLLRDPQYRQALRDRGYPEMDRGLVRRVSLGSGAVLTLVPITYRQTTPHSHGLGTRTTFTLHGPRIEGLGLGLAVPGTGLTEASPSTVEALKAHGANVFTYVRDHNLGVIVVPDGVATVTLSHVRVISHVKVPESLIPATTVHVAQNLAVFSLTAPVVMSHGNVPGRGAPGMYSTGAYARMTWRASDGKIINRATILIAFNFIARAHP